MVRCMQRLSCRSFVRALLVIGLATVLNGLHGRPPARAAELQSSLALDVTINGAVIHVIGTFVRFPGGMIGAARSELESLGLRVSASHSTADMVMLSEIPSLKYVYEERAQRIRITVDDAYRLPHAFDLGSDSGVVHPQSDWGAVVNYDLFSNFNTPLGSTPFAFNGTSLTLDARTFSPFGTFEQTGIASYLQNHQTDIIRLDSSYRFSDPEHMIAWSAGDTINGALSWTRPIRIGGMQVQRDFALRPDLVTMPIANLGGTAAVPSTVDLYINNTRTFTEELVTGPFALTNIPLVNGAGNAQMVIRDSSGHETMTNVPFYNSANLLAPGLSSWSAEVGLPRISFGSTADTYVRQPVGSATWRRGITDWFTAEGHAEGGSGVANGGLGSATRTGTFGIATAALAASTLVGNMSGASPAGGGRGMQAAVSFETNLSGIILNIGSQRAFGDYEDLASVTARQQAITFAPTSGAASSSVILAATSTALQIYGSSRAPLALDRVTVGGLLPFDPSSNWSVSYVHEVDASHNISQLASASYSRSLPYNTSFFATAFKDYGSGGGVGVLIGLTIPLGQTTSASSTLSNGLGGTTGTMDVSHPLGNEYGSVGWRVQDQEGAQQARQGTLAYRSPVMTVQAGATESRSGGAAVFDAAGSVATMGGGIFFSNHIGDAFAVVDAGAPNVPVLYENRAVGTTDSHGMLLVPTLRSFQKNKLSIDPSNLPVDAEVESTDEVVTPADRSGALVPFKVHSDRAAALVVLTRTDGKFLPAGSTGRLDGGDAFVVGYDGQVFVKGLAASNQLTADLGEGTCHASFTFKPRPGEQVRIGPVICR
jgi:outer membrane usher protein